MEIANIERFLLQTLKLTKNQNFTLFLKDKFSKNLRGCHIDPPVVLWLKRR